MGGWGWPLLPARCEALGPRSEQPWLIVLKATSARLDIQGLLRSNACNLEEARRKARAGRGGGPGRLAAAQNEQRLDDRASAASPIDPRLRGSLRATRVHGAASSRATGTVSVP